MVAESGFVRVAADSPSQQTCAFLQHFWYIVSIFLVFGFVLRYKGFGSQHDVENIVNGSGLRSVSNGWVAEPEGKE